MRSSVNAGSSTIGRDMIKNEGSCTYSVGSCLYECELFVIGLQNAVHDACCMISQLVSAEVVEKSIKNVLHCTCPAAELEIKHPLHTVSPARTCDYCKWADTWTDNIPVELAQAPRIFSQYVTRLDDSMDIHDVLDDNIETGIDDDLEYGHACFEGLAKLPLLVIFPDRVAVVGDPALATATLSSWSAKVSSATIAYRLSE